MNHKDSPRWLYINVGNVVRKKNVLSTLSVALEPNSIFVLNVKKRFKKRVDRPDTHSIIKVLLMGFMFFLIEVRISEQDKNSD